ISGDGRFVTFSSLATNLVSNDTNNSCDRNFDGVFDENCEDVFVRDTQTGETTRVSVDSSSIQANGDSFGPTISADGRFVAFESGASNLVGDDTNQCTYLPGWSCPDIFVHDRLTGTTKRVNLGPGGI